MAHLLIWGKSSELLAGERPTGAVEEVQTFGGVLASLDGKGPTLVLADPKHIEAEATEVRSWIESKGKTQAVLIAVSEPEDGDAVLDRLDFVDDVVARPVTPKRLQRKLERAFERIQHNRVAVQLQESLARKDADLRLLNDIGVSLSAERDIDQLLDKILQKSRQITRADAGSLYLVDWVEEDGRIREQSLRFKLAQNDSVAVPFKESTFPLDERSMAGYAALHGETVRIEDAYRIPPDEPYQFSRSFDEESGYRTKSVLVVPMLNHKKEVIGVVQLINKKTKWDTALTPVSIVDEEVTPFSDTDKELVGSLASQAAVAYQNADLIDRIRRLFDQFVEAAVKAVEMRDPVTSGHSGRVAVLTVGLAKKVDALSTGPLADVRLTRDQMEELRYASILHDFGKVAVPEKVLKKGKKLLGSELKNIELRFAFRARALEAKYLRRKMEAIDSKSLGGEELAALDGEYQAKRHELQQALQAIRLANEPRLVEEQGLAALEACLATVRALPVRDFETNAEEQLLPVELWGGDGPLLTKREREALLIPRGSLTQDERENKMWGINSHVEHTYEFLKKIPWTGEFRRIPEIAWKHHEKLDGSGYPHNLTASNIPVQSRMMTVSDIFDALRAWDRPYKRAQSPERSLDILADEVEQGKLDRDLLRVFVESRIWDSDEYKALLHTSGSRGKKPRR